MPKVSGTLFSLRAVKSFKKLLLFQGKKGLDLVFKYHKPGDINPFTPSAAQLTQREKIAALVAQWQALSAADKKTWNDLAAAKGYVGTGYHLYIATATITPSEASRGYYFDCSDGGPTDPDEVWSNDANVFDNSQVNIGYVTTSGSVSENYLKGDGCNAPGSGDTIVSVKTRAFNGYYAKTLKVAVYTDGLGELLGTITSDPSVGWGDWVTLSEPDGGWTWEKVQALEVKAYSPDATGGMAGCSLIELLVTYEPSSAITEGNSGFLSPSATGGKYNEWDDPTYAYSENQQYATPGWMYNRQDWGGFPFSIPAGATITGIEVKILGHRDYGSGDSFLLYITPDDFSTYSKSRVAKLKEETDVVDCAGHQWDLWGLSWSPSDFNGGDFRVYIEGLSGSGQLDHLTVNVYYEEAA